ncbi:hypothetical protein DRW41_22280 [Neobacillus piezotolerans]|uniref:Putative Flp pilus-assembly TadG-like N-terminal domain-containing protein n=1 Tax=Neobacillus piezotolerans TaxID=2259171 RepID=A0A3D8GJM6_9BACI|nr:Tad domain-containing protein [Neobacillus piezotolerans]RDU34660.1 hypothetical protein DRW41_22280 [Neobacillus piezotolerans]
MKSMKKILCSQEGNGMIMVAFFMVVLFGFSAMVIDGGRLYLEKSRLQKALDAAVLAGAQDLLKGESVAKQTAIDIAAKNNVVLVLSDFKTGPNYIQATKSVSKGLTFAKFIGVNSSDVAASAKAQISGKIISREGIVPIGIPKAEYPTTPPESGKEPPSFSINFKPGNSGNGKDDDEENSSIGGNFGFLQIDKPGGKQLLESIKEGIPMDLETKYVLTNTGLNWGNVKEGFEYRINLDKKRNDCNKYLTADDTCARVVLVPIIKSYADVNGKTYVELDGFASVWIDDVKKHEVTAKFIKLITFGEIGKGVNYGVEGVKLVH